MKIIKISTLLIKGYGKKNTLQMLYFSLVLQAKPLVKAVYELYVGALCDK